MNKQSFKEDLLCNITLICVLAFAGIHLLLLTLNLFSVTHFALYENFSYAIAYVMVIVSLALYIISFYTYAFSKIYMPAWFRMLFYVAFYLFTNVYYICNWYASIVGLIFFFAYIAFLVCIISLSIYFNTQKDEKNKLKISPKSLLTSVFFYSIGANALVQFVINLIKVIAFENYKFTNLSTYLIEFGTMTSVCVIVIIAFAMSLARTKTFINACLIKVNNR